MYNLFLDSNEANKNTRTDHKSLLENMRLAIDLATDFYQNRLLIQLATDLATN
jgi:hypothetical protein